MIPKKIFTIWLSLGNKPLPLLIQRCIESQKIAGYEHKVITLENCYRGSKYVNEALAKAEYLYKNNGSANDPHTNPLTWIVKAVDWLRCYHVCQEGGIYLDADVEVLPGKNFDDLLDNRFFTANEVLGLSANCVFGTEAQHPFLVEYLRRVEENFRGDGVFVFEPGIRAFADLMWITDKVKDGIKIYDTKMFFPYHHATGKIEITPETRVFHHYAKTWCMDPKENKLIGDYYLKKLF